MANAEQLEILKQGVSIWNKWRIDNPDVMIDLSEVDLRRRDFVRINFEDANLHNTTLIKTHLMGANIFAADLSDAKLLGATLSGANLSRADLSRANLKACRLYGVNLKEVDFTGTDLTSVRLGNTIFGDNDLSNAIGLETILHRSSSTLGTSTIQLSKGKFPIEFLRSCGFSDWEIEFAKLYDPGLTNSEIDEILYKVHDMRAQQPLQIFPLFISYSHEDSSFVDEMEEHLNAKGIRFWRDVYHATAGRLEKQIDRAIRHNPTVLLVLSENSIKSDWVEHEVRTARELEKETGRDVLCPVALDDSWKKSPWPKRIMEQVTEYNILDFSKWDDDAEFGKLFRKLIDGLELFYK